jgi:hypothetical protein
LIPIGSAGSAKPTGGGNVLPLADEVVDERQAGQVAVAQRLLRPLQPRVDLAETSTPKLVSAAAIARQSQARHSNTHARWPSALLSLANRT